MNADHKLLRRLYLGVSGTIGAFTPLRELAARDARRRAPAGDAWDPVFIVGAPRTGTTILYQLLLGAYRFAYLCNLDALLFTAPALSDRLTGAFKDKLEDKGSESAYGYVPGLFHPSEAGAVFRLWFGGEPGQESTAPLDHIRAMQGRCGAPFLCKNTLNSLRIPAICERVPGARFVWVRRDLDKTCDSILRWRRESTGSESNWVGAQPPGWEHWADLEPREQVRRQILAIEAQIRATLPPDDEASMIVEYETLCGDVPACLEGLRIRLARAGGQRWVRTGRALPSRLRYR